MDLTGWDCFLVAFSSEMMCLIIPRWSECSTMTQGSGLKYVTNDNKKGRTIILTSLQPVSLKKQLLCFYLLHIHVHTVLMEDVYEALNVRTNSLSGGQWYTTVTCFNSECTAVGWRLRVPPQYSELLLFAFKWLLKTP